MTKNIIGIIWMLIHVVCSVVLSIYYRILSEYFHPLQISFFYNFSAFLIILPIILKKRKQLIKSCFVLAHAYRAASYVAAQLILIFVYHNMPFAQVSAITITYPLFTTVFAVLFLREKIGIHRLIALIIGFIGAVIIIHPDPYDFNKYSLLAITAVIMWATFDMITNKIGDKENMLIQLLYVIFFMGLFSIFPMVLVPLPTSISLHHLILFGLFGVIIIIYMFSAVLAVAQAEINIVSPFFFCALILSSMVGYFIFNEQLKVRTIIGAIIILASIIYIAYREYRAKQIAQRLQQSRLI